MIREIISILKWEQIWGPKIIVLALTFNLTICNAVLVGERLYATQISLFDSILD